MSNYPRYFTLLLTPTKTAVCRESYAGAPAVVIAPIASDFNAAHVVAALTAYEHGFDDREKIFAANEKINALESQLRNTLAANAQLETKLKDARNTITRLTDELESHNQGVAA